MKMARWVLLTFLALTALMQLVEGIASLADPAGMMAGLGAAMSPGVEIPITFLGVSMIVRAGVTAIALLWLFRARPEGLFLARFTAITILLSAPIVYFKLHRPEFAIGDLVQGLLLLIPALLVGGSPGEKG